MNIVNKNRETFFIAVNCTDGLNLANLYDSMPDDKSSIELNIYYNCPANSSGTNLYKIDGQNVIDPKHLIEQYFYKEHTCGDPMYHRFFCLFCSIQHIITMTKHNFCAETGTISSKQPEVIYAGLSTENKNSAFQIIFYTKNNSPDLKYLIPKGTIYGSAWNLELAGRDDADNVISVTSYAFDCNKIDYNSQSYTGFNGSFEEVFFDDQIVELLENPDFYHTVKNHSCALTVAANYYHFETEPDSFSGNTSLYESIKFFN